MDTVKGEKNLYFTSQTVLVQHDLLAHPVQIYNVDMSGVPLTRNIVTKTGSRICYRQAGKPPVTFVSCNAAGQSVLPMIIFNAKNLNYAWIKDEVPGFQFGLSDNGWIY